MEYETYVRCPEIWQPSDDLRCHARTLFLGGGITGTTPWQESFANSLNHCDLIIFDPRRKDFDVNDPDMTVKQIEWEFYHLRVAKARVFWFPPQTLCPIALFELGKYVEKTDQLFVGCHPEYKRKTDLEIQLKLARPYDCNLSYSLEEISDKIRNWAKQ